MIEQWPRSTPDSLGTANWSDASPPWQDGHIWIGRDADGGPVGCFDNRHMVTVAGSRAGKGVSAIIPNLCLWPGSCVVIDPKGENAARTAATRAARPGHKVVVIDPYLVSGVSGALLGSFNPFDLIDVTSDSAIDIAGAIGDALVVPSGGHDVHWDESSRQLIEGLILHVAATEGGGDITLGRLRTLLTQGDADMAEMVTERTGKPMDRFAALWSHMETADIANPHVKGVVDGASQSIRAMGDNERGSVLSTARRNTKFLDSPAVANVLATSTFGIDELKTASGGMTVYLCLPARFLATHARFLRLILNLVLFRMEAVGLSAPSTGHPVLFVMDEFAALGRLEVIEKAAGLMAGYGVKLWPVLQDLTQLKRHYQESWETFLGNAGMLQFFGNTDLTTLEWISKRMGEAQVVVETKGSSSQTSTGTGTSTTDGETHGQSRSEGANDGKSQMAALSSLQGRQGGEGLMSMFTRSGASDVSHSTGKSITTGLSAQASTSKGTSTSTSESETVSLNRTAHARPLMRVDEIAKAFDRATGLQLVFIGGDRPLVTRRSHYYDDPQFLGLYNEDPAGGSAG